MKLLRPILWTLIVWSSAVYSQLEAQSWPTNSVLSKGQWAEVFTDEDFVYRLSGADLEQLGMGSPPFESSKLGIWGRQSGAMSEVNASSGEARDLSPVPIRIEDGGDGLLGSTEYLYFLGQSPHRWIIDSIGNRWSRSTNPYASRQTYFATTTEGGSRIAPYAVQPSSPQTVSRYHHVFGMN